MLRRVFVCILVSAISSFALKDTWQASNNDYLLPVRSSDPGATADAADAPLSCPHFVHGELRHSLMTPPSPRTEGSNAGGNARFDWLAPRSDGVGQFWSGGMVTVPATASVSVVAPLPGNAGRVCGRGATATVAETAARRGCAVALNAGLFDPESGRCLGNLVSDGAVLHDSAGVKNAHFGVTANGEIFFGYLTEDQLTAGYFKQLVGGAIWLVRNGTNSVERSIRAECSATQTTGSLRRFATVVSARSAVGQRRTGELVLLQIAGKTDIAGINLFDLADLLISLDVYNAINLDGGGSSALVVNGTVVGSPSDRCPESTHLTCLRPVTSILCVPTAAPAPAGCGPCNPDGGACVAGRCLCRPPHVGRGCYERCRCLNSAPCSPDTGDCLCPPGYRGGLCESRCERGFYGPGCARVCVCGVGDAAGCHHVNGTCPGDAGAEGEASSPNGAYNLVMLVRRRLSSLNWAVLILPLTLAASCLLNACLLVRQCRLRRAADRLQTRWLHHRKEMHRLVEEAPSSEESDRAEAGL